MMFTLDSFDIRLQKQTDFDVMELKSPKSEVTKLDSLLKKSIGAIDDKAKE